MTHAILIDGPDPRRVLNTVDWDGGPGWSPDEGCVAVECPPTVGIGFIYEAGEFLRPDGASSLDILLEQVNASRDARIDGGFTHDGHRFQSRPSDRENVMGAAQAAQMAIAQGAQPGDLRWADAERDFVWITADNELVPMDAYAVLGLFQRGVQFKTALTFHARGLKDALIAAEDPSFVDIETGWPE